MTENIIILSPKFNLYNDKLILISPGSGGLGQGETNIANFFLSKGYTVILNNYFKPVNIKELFWDDGDIKEISLKELIHNTDIKFDKKIIHLGFSLGGYFGLVHATKFYKNYCFYPGLIGFTKKQLKQDFSNTTVFLPTKDNWCNNYNVFRKNIDVLPKEIILKNKYHGFMNLEKNKKFVVNRYLINNICLDDTELDSFLLNYTYLSSKYSYEKVKIRLKYDEKSYIMCLNYIIKDIQ